ELARGGIVEGEDHRRRAGRQRDAAVEELAEGDEPVAPRVERLEIAPEVLGRARPALFGVVDLVVLEDHHAAELVGRGRGPGRTRTCVCAARFRIRRTLSKTIW